jgi:dolichol-phosphate hexosyltransferase
VAPASWSSPAAATDDVIVTADADGTYPVERLQDFVDDLLRRDLDFLNCDRYGELKRGAMSAKHRFGNWVLSTTARVLYFVRIRDSQSGMWVIRRSALAHVPYESLSEGMAFSQEIKIEFWKRRRGRCAEVPSSLAPRIGRPVLSSWRDGLGNLWALVRRRATTRYRAVPAASKEEAAEAAPTVVSRSE